MQKLQLILMVAAFVLFFLAMINVPSARVVNLIAAGLACLTAAELLGNWKP